MFQEEQELIVLINQDIAYVQKSRDPKRRRRVGAWNWEGSANTELQPCGRSSL